MKDLTRSCNYFNDLHGYVSVAYILDFDLRRNAKNHLLVLVCSLCGLEHLKKKVVYTHLWLGILVRDHPRPGTGDNGGLPISS